jgi:hypothetical protein
VSQLLDALVVSLEFLEENPNTLIIGTWNCRNRDKPIEPSSSGAAQAFP